MSYFIAHRGGDEKGQYAEGPVAMAHRRHSLGLGDLKGPLVNEKWILNLDARLYNCDEKQFLEQWTQKGINALDEINGPFSMAAWDRQENELWLVRSPMGQRPLFWTQSGQKLAFCSEIPGLLGLPWVSKELAVEHLAEQLSFRYVHAPKTLYRNIQAIPAGHVLKITEKGQQLSRWWQPGWRGIEEAWPDPDQCAEQIDNLLHKSVAQRLKGNKPVGILLSGGLDSSAILHHACVLRSPPVTYTVALEGVRDESPFAARVAKVMGADNNVIRISNRELIDGFHEATLKMGEPLSSAAGVIQNIFFKKINGEIGVVLSGDGGDEILGGRSMPELARRIFQARQISRLPYVGRRILRGIAKRLGQKDLAADHHQFGMERSIGASRIFLAPNRVDILTDPGLARPGIRRNILTPYYQQVDSDPINEILHVWQQGWLVQDSLARADRFSSANGVEIRYPMLAPDLIEKCTEIPGQYKVRRRGLEFVAKWPLRHCMKERLPEKLLYRPKRTLLHPLDIWLRKEGAVFLKEQVEGICENLPHLFVPKMVRRLQKEHLQGKKNNGLRLWTLALFHLWHEAFEIPR